MKFLRVKTCCESLNINCDQGRKCPHRKHTINTVTDEIVMLEKPFQWLQDLLYTTIFIGGSVLLGALILVFIVLATGLHRVFF